RVVAPGGTELELRTPPDDVEDRPAPAVAPQPNDALGAIHLRRKVLDHPSEPPRRERDFGAKAPALEGARVIVARVIVRAMIVRLVIVRAMIVRLVIVDVRLDG